MPRASACSITFSSAVRQSSSTWFWNTMPMSVRALVTRWLSTSTWPSDAEVRPAAIIIRVLLPQPLGPTSEMNSPLRWAIETRSSARTGPSSDG
ncbi:hypothetical protein V1284_002000 [Nitrobacteraceae bacterium AZCC 2299]